ncbi:hypothetical protein V0288_17165 [Pannus brasiliensis CCIBt3594]|uniref:Uncharacterized protein n=1 Tax=Pannus brasiliensis CCIBt3594 TaxID=1427578 RepID=A0AAW9QYZ6_9CHRO
MTTERWDDERLDRLASTVENLSLRMNEFAERDIQLASTVGTTSLRVNDLRKSIGQTTHNVDMLVGAVNAFIERDNERRQEIERSRQESEAYRRENDQRFNILLEEIRFLVRRLGSERGD